MFLIQKGGLPMNQDSKNMVNKTLPPGFQAALEFPLAAALLGRRSRRFFRGAEIPDGIFAYKSKHDPLPLSELEKLLVVTACAGNTGWHNMIYRGERYAPNLSNYSAAAAGRTFPSAAGFYTSRTFFTDDEGVYVLEMRDSEPDAEHGEDGEPDLDEVLNAFRRRIRKLRDGRLPLPAKVPHVEAHNTWVANHPGSLLVIPVGDLAQHVLLNLCYMLQNGLVLTDDINKRRFPESSSSVTLSMSRILGLSPLSSSGPCPSSLRSWPRAATRAC
jgi:hypothetical protein